MSPAAAPRVVATDLDGTLLRDDGTVSDRTRAALEGAWAAGIETVFVTARPPRWLDPLADVVGGHGIALCTNGSYVYDVAARQVVSEVGLTRAEVLALTADLRAAVPGIGFMGERADGPWREQRYADPHEGDDQGLVVGALDELDETLVGKLLATSSEVAAEEFLLLVEQVVGERGVVAYSGVRGLAEIGAPGVSKATGLARWCSERGFGAQDVWAFGDMPNDLPMLGWAGRSFAVANAHPDVLAAATDTCPSNEDDGVATVLEGLGHGIPGPGR